jgi:hypothetical protein
MSKNRNFITNLYYSIFREKITITNIKTNEKKIYNDNELKKKTLIIGMYLILFYLNMRPELLINAMVNTIT